MDDELLQKMVGTWHISRRFPNRTAENTAEIGWVLQGAWLRIDMKDVLTPSRYDAHVYITKMESDACYSIHWLDNFGGQVPDVLGVGHRFGDCIEFLFKEPNSELRNTFTWHQADQSWISKIEQKGESGEWKEFCVDHYVRN